ncbi:GerAB/ArcD/ProY family transporter [Paenibacillus arenilitoris]|uniref:Endospore germination permease n=1 Tax=Paenibacillus arenilitoris TaxID=2772299 RepID=A0A927H6V7_9BACL|nr:endospore germination permease [Paenibacillus arenilitoris]MBD2869897.1 endospore germination permease [Paenibacillus arenilitoris]
MAGGEKISIRQFTVLAMFYTIGTTILVIPSTLASDAKQNAWIASIAGLLASMAIVALYIAIGRLYPNTTLAGMLEAAFGKWLGKLATLAFIFFSFVGGSAVLYYMGNFMTTQIMPETPIGAFIVLFGGLVVIGVRLGLEVLARTAEILFPWFLMLFIVSALFLLPEIDLANVKPIVGIGLKPIAKASLAYTGTATLPLVLFLMFFPAALNRKQGAGKALLVGNVIGGLFIVIVTYLSISVLGADFSSRNLYPSYALAKKINIGNFIQRVEILMAGMWFLSIFFKAAFYAYGFAAGLARLCGCKDYRPLALPCGMILIAYSLVVYPNVVYMMDFDSTVYIPYAISTGLLLPLLLLAAGLIRKKPGGRTNE